MSSQASSNLSHHVHLVSSVLNLREVSTSNIERIIDTLLNGTSQNLFQQYPVRDLKIDVRIALKEYVDKLDKVSIL